MKEAKSNLCQFDLFYSKLDGFLIHYRIFRGVVLN